MEAQLGETSQRERERESSAPRWFTRRRVTKCGRELWPECSRPHTILAHTDVGSEVGTQQNGVKESHETVCFR